MWVFFIYVIDVTTVVFLEFAFAEPQYIPTKSNKPPPFENTICLIWPFDLVIKYKTYLTWQKC